MDIKMKKNVLFVCAHNSARSQTAEAYFKKAGSKKFEESYNVRGTLMSFS
ncbi:low molecular weight phosphatase family protein [Desulfobacter curvatus]|nr:hypothetical protein [Desulfobacter curvatus]